jgi:hypothetical protein
MFTYLHTYLHTLTYRLNGKDKEKIFVIVCWHTLYNINCIRQVKVHGE